MALIPASELAGLLETAHLLRSPRNARRLLTALRRAKPARWPQPPVRTSGERSSVAREIKRAAVFHVVFHKEFREDLRYWVKTHRNTAWRVLDLVDAVLHDPFQALAKPEPLRYVLEGCRSRRVTQEHRLVYRVTGDRIDFLQARYHY